MIKTNAPGYEKLIVWQNSYKLRILIYNISSSFPKIEYRRITQMRDAARPVKQNIQEGYKRCSTLEYMRFLNIAQSSLAELKGDVRDCSDDGLIGQEEFRNLDSLICKTDYLFNRLIKALKQKVEKKRTTPLSPVPPASHEV